MYRKHILNVLVAVLCCLIGTCFTASIFNIEPNHGSIAGGTRVTIYGSAFSMAHSSDANLVWIGGAPCKVLEYYTSQSSITCMTEASPDGKDGEYPVRVQIDNLSYATCASADSKCTFTYSSRDTPLLKELLPAAATAGSTVSFSGKILESDPAKFSDLVVGGQRCSVEKMIEADGPVDLQYDYDDNLGYVSGWGKISCQLPENLESGYYNASFTVSQLGAASLDQAYWYLSPDNIPYQFASIPEISSIDSHVGSIHGGLVLTIKGKGFNTISESNIVDIDGEKCQILSSSFNQIQCITPSSNPRSGSRFKGRRGLKRDVWYGIEGDDVKSLQSNPAFPNKPSESDIVVDHFESPNVNKYERYGQRMYGFFSPRVSGDHIFYISSDRQGVVYLSNDTNPANAVKIVENQSNRYREYETFNPSVGLSQSPPVSLVAGKLYYIEGLHKKGAGSLEHFSVGVSYPSTATQSTIGEVQTIKINVSVVREIQKLKFTNVVGGSFRIALRSSATDFIDFNASTETIRVAIESKLKAGSVIVSKIVNNNVVEFTITFNSASNGDRPLMLIDESMLTPKSGASVLTEVIRIQSASAPVSGSFDITLNGATARNIPYNVERIKLKEILQSLPGVGHVDVNVFGNADDGRFWTVMFKTIVGDVPLMEVTGNLNGTGVAISVQETIKGSANPLLGPIPADMLFTMESKPQIHVTTNNILASCAFGVDCSFEYSTNISPSIITASPLKGTNGTVITIQGENFSTNSQDNSVTIGGATCVVLSSSSTEIQCMAIEVAGGKNNLEVHVFGVGKSNEVIFNGEFDVLDIFPESGSLAGGQIVTISGFGFSEKTSVSMDDKECVVVSVSYDSIECMTPSLGSYADNHEVFVDINIDDMRATTMYNYTSEDTPEITSVTPINFSVLEFDKEITINGNGFTGEDIEVRMGDIKCAIKSISSTQIKCILAAGGAGNLPVVVNVPGKGNAYGSFVVNRMFKVNDISPQRGSMAGGLLVTIKGEGLLMSTDLQVSIGGISCIVQNSSVDNQINCITGRISYTDSYNVVVSHSKTDYESVCGTNCKFEYSDALTPRIESVTPAHGVAGESITLSGNTFSSNPVVTIGGAPCEVSSSSPTSIVCVLASHEATTSAAIVVSFDGIGYADFSSEALGSFAYDLKIDSVSPQQGSTAGYLMKISGSGFSKTPKKNVIMYGDHSCEVVKSSASEITCRTSPYVDANNGPVLLVVNQVSSICDSCDITFSEKLTPVLSSWGPNKGSRGTVLTFAGTGFSTELAKNTISIGEYTCKVVSASETSLSCEVQDVVAGYFVVSIYVEGKGYVSSGDLSLTFESQLTAGVASGDLVGSFAGGSMVTIQSGSGFSEKQGETSVTICGSPCHIQSVQYGSLTCETSRFVNKESFDQFKWRNEQLIKGQAIGSGGAKYERVFDADENTHFDSSYDMRSKCFVGIDVGSQMSAIPTTIKFLPRTDIIDGRERMNGRFEASVTGADGSWNTLYSIQSLVSTGWNTVPIPAEVAQQYRFFRYVGGTESYCSVNEIQFNGYVLSNNAGDSCDIEVQVNGVKRVATNSFTYTKERTAVISSISPNQGTAAGGTIVTITGSGFTGGNIDVTINGVSCTDVLSLSETEIQCTTGERQGFFESSEIKVNVVGKGRAAQLGDVSFLYIDRWSARTTWGNNDPPRLMETVVIPVGQTILLDISPPKLRLLIIEGTLIFEDAQDLRLDAEYIFIHGGRLQIGTEEKPFTHSAVITLYGDRYTTPEIPMYGAKCMALRVGLVDMHGVPRTSWTRLGATVQAGEDVLTFASETDWNVGDKIVVAPSDYDMFEAEELTVVERIDATKVRVQPALKFSHFGEIQMFDGKQIDTRAEVGLLNRNVVFQGDESSPSQEFGAHFMIHSVGDESSVARISNCEFRRAGQSSRLGRYPIHYHMIGNVSKSFVKNTAIHHTWNRAIAIHGVHYLRIHKNFAYHIKGHTYFIEDGIETNNELIENLGILTLPSFSLLNSDISPAVFWITNPNNIFKKNAAAGSDHYGFWFDLPEHPTGASAGNDQFCPRYTRLGEFSDNIAHSVGRYGLRLFETFHPRLKPCSAIDAMNPTVPANFNLFTSYKNGRNGMIATLVGDVRFNDFRVSDNKRAGMEVSWILPEAPANSARITNSLVVALSNLPAGISSIEAGGIVTPRTENFMINNVTFVGFNSKKLPALNSCSKCDFNPTQNQGGYTSKISGLKFIDSDYKIKWGYPFKDIYYDMDGTLTGRAGGWAIPAHPHNNHTACHYSTFHDGFVCDETIGVHRVALFFPQPDSLHHKDLILTTSFGQSHIEWMKKSNPINGWVFPAINGQKIGLWFDTYIDWEYLYFNMNRMQFKDYFYLRINHTDVRDHFDISVGSTMVPVGKEELNSSMPHGSSVYHSSDNTLDVLVRGPATVNELSFQIISIAGKRCPNGGCPVPPRPNYEERKGVWSSSLLWGARGVPKEGEDVVINPGWVVTLDVSPPKLRKLEIQGTLIFANKDLNLDVDMIYLRNGTLQIGSESNPFTNKATITLYGTSKSFPLLISDEFDLGPKVLANFGSLKLYGAPRTASSRLVSTVNAGASSITVSGKMDWVVGDVIAIGTSTSKFEQSESRTVSAVSFDGDNTVVSLNTPLSYRHYGSKLTVGSNSFDIRAVVALLTRNIVIRGNDITEKFGAHVFIGQTTDGGYWNRGTTTLSNVEFIRTGQVDNARSSILFRGLREGVDQVVSGCSIHDGYNNAVAIEGTNSVLVSNVISYKTINSAFRTSLDSRRNTFTNNIAIRVEHSPSTETQDKQLHPVAAFDLRGLNNARGNIAVGSEYLGFIIEADSCSDSNFRFVDNQVHGAFMGVFITNSTTNCNKISNWLVNKVSHIGYFTYTAASIEADKLVAIDTHIGTSLNVAWYEDDSQHTSISNSIFVGESDNYVPTGDDDCYSRAGIYAAIHSTERKSMPPSLSMIPWENQHGDPTRFGKDTIRGITFANFLNTPRRGCEMTRKLDKAFQTNPMSPDVTRIQHFDSISWINVGTSARFFLNDPDPKWRNEDDCGNMDCEGLKQVAIMDVDGTVTGAGVGSSVVSYNPNIVDASKCSLVAGWNAYLCKNVAWRQLFLESLDVDAMTRRVAPLAVTNMERNQTAYLNNPQDHRWHLDYTSRMRLTNFWPLVEPSHAYQLGFTGTNPKHMKFYLVDAPATESVVCVIKYSGPDKLRILNGQGRYIEPKSTAVTHSDINGANTYEYKKRILTFVVRGSDNIEIFQVPVIQVSIRMDVDLNDFFAENFVANLAGTLGIDKSLIRIVDIRKGSTIVDFEIEEPVATDATGTPVPPSEDKSLTAIYNNLMAKAQNNELANVIGYPILNFTALVTNTTGDEETKLFDEPVEPEKKPTKKSTSKAGLYVAYAVAGVAGVVIIAVLIVVVAVAMIYKARSLEKKRIISETIVVEEAEMAELSYTVNPDPTYPTNGMTIPPYTTVLTQH